MENKTTLHPIHPTLQFEAKQAIRFLDNLLKVRTPSVNCGSDLFGAVPVFASGRDLKDHFASLQGAIGDYDFKWTKDTLECSCDSCRNAVRRGTFEVDFGEAPCDFFTNLWDCPQGEVRACVRAAVSSLAKAVSEIEPAKDGGVASRFKTIVRRYKLNARERDLLLVGLCDAHDLLEYDLDSLGGFRNFLRRLEEAAAYLACGVDDLLPLVRDDSKLVACGLLENDLTPSRDILEYLEGHVSRPTIKSNRLSSGEATALEDWLDDDDCE